MELNLPDSVRYEKRDRIAVITMNRPEAMNSLTKEMLIGLEAAFDDFEADPALRVAIFTGAGERAFCTGLDLKVAMPALTEGDSMGYDHPAKRPFQRNYKPIITAVNGMCVAGGLEFMLGTDIRVAASHAKFGLAEVRWAVVPAGGSHIRLPQQIPWKHAMEMLLTGQLMDAETAVRFGLAERGVPADQLDAAVQELADLIASKSPYTVALGKRGFNRQLAMTRSDAYDFVVEQIYRNFQAEDAQEGISAFVEKRKPAFKHR